jgi:aminopeptidase
MFQVGRNSAITLSKRLQLISLHHRTMSTSTALVIPHDPTIVQSSSGPGKLWSHVAAGEKKAGTTRIFYDTPKDSGKITVLGSLGEKFGETKGDSKRELVRKAVGSAVKGVRGLGIGEGGVNVEVDGGLDAHAAGKPLRDYYYFQAMLRVCKNHCCLSPIAVAAHLASYKFTLKTSPPSAFNPNLKESIPEQLKLSAVEKSQEWETGVVYANGQNLARTVRVLSSIVQ